MNQYLSSLPKLAGLQIVIVNWRGPFDAEGLRTLKEGNGVYMATGRFRYGRKDDILYFGITKREFKKRLLEPHPTYEIREETKQVWVGQLVFPVDFHRGHLGLVENLLIWFWQPLLNIKKKLRPKHQICLINQWFWADGAQQRIQRPSVIKDVPDVIWINDEMHRTGKLTKWRN